MGCAGCWAYCDSRAEDSRLEDVVRTDGPPPPIDIAGPKGIDAVAMGFGDDDSELRSQDPVLNAIDRTTNALDARLSRELLTRDAQKKLNRLEKLGPFLLADDSKHDWRPKMFENNKKGANLSSENTTGYSVVNEVKWWVKIKEGFVPQCLLEPNVFAATTRDTDGDRAFKLIESPQYPVTLEADAKKICNIPADADQFSFLYPVAPGILNDDAVKSATAGPNGDKVNANLALLTVGAFAYWKGGSAFPALALRPLDLADVGLSFSLPRDLGLLDGDGRLGSSLCWHAVTLDFLKGVGVEAFTWINPSRPDLLPHLNYFSTRADEEMEMPHGEPSIKLENVHKIDKSGRPLWGPNQSVQALQVSDVQGTRARPNILKALTKYNLRDPLTGHHYQFAQNGAFAYKMTDGSIRYFDVVDTFVRPMALDLKAADKLRKNPAYVQVCQNLVQCLDKCQQLPLGKRPMSEWNIAPGQWNNFAKALDAVTDYEDMLIKYYASEQDECSKLDDEEIGMLANARRNEILPLDTLLEPNPPVTMKSLGPIALLNCSWQAGHFTLLFDTMPNGAESNARDSVEQFREFASSLQEVSVNVLALPTSLQSISDAFANLGAAPVQTKMSPVSLVTLPLLSRIKAGIPLDATHFAFMYPADDTRIASAASHRSFKRNDHENDLSLLLMGGFVYLNESGHIVNHGVKTLRFNVEGLRFSSVRDFDVFVEASNGLAKTRRGAIGNPVEELEEKKWWHPITANALQSMRVTHFCWLPPSSGQQPPLTGLANDSIKLGDPASHQPYVLGAHGSFLYKCASSASSVRVVYFDVLPDPSAALFAQLERLESFESVKDFIEALKRRLLGFNDKQDANRVIMTGFLRDRIVEASKKSKQCVCRMIADYARAISDMQVEKCTICQEDYSSDRPRRTFRVCKHTVCFECEKRVSKCPLCNKTVPEPKLADDWMQKLDNPDELAALFETRDIDIAAMWWQRAE